MAEIMKIYIHTVIALATCFASFGCISLQSDSTTPVLRKTIIPRLDIRHADAEDVVAWFRSAYLEYRQPDDPDLLFVIEPQVKSVIVGNTVTLDGSMLIGEGSTATASLLEEMQRMAELANLVIVVERQTVTFRGK